MMLVASPQPARPRQPTPPGEHPSESPIRVAHPSRPRSGAKASPICDGDFSDPSHQSELPIRFAHPSPRCEPQMGCLIRVTHPRR